MSIQNKMKNIWLSVGVLLPLTSFSQNVLKLDINQIQIETTSNSFVSSNSGQVIKLDNQIISTIPSLNLSAIIQDESPKFKNASVSIPAKTTTVNKTKLSFSENDLLINTNGSWVQVESFNSFQFGNITHIAKNTKSTVLVFTQSKVIHFDFIRLKVLNTIGIPDFITNGKVISNDGIIVISNKDQSYTFDRTNLKFSKFSKSEIEDISMVSGHKYILVEKKSDKNSFNISYKNIEKGIISSEKQIGDSYVKKPLLSASNGRIWVASENKLEMLNLEGNRNDFCLQFTREIKSIQNDENRIELIFSDGGKFGMRTNSGNSEITAIVSDDSQKSADLKKRFIFDSDGLFLVRSDKNSSDITKKSSFIFDRSEKINSTLPQSDFLFTNLKCSWCQVVGAVYDRTGSEILSNSDDSSFPSLLKNSQSLALTQRIISPMGASGV